jgi:uncharacterized membrane protein YgcG
MFRGFGRQALALACFVFILLCPVSSRASDVPDATEHIEYFDVDVLISRDGTLDVRETIRYAFGQTEKHGIFRDIPIKYVTSLGVQESITIDDVSVQDETGTSLTHVESRNGGNLHIKIGDADQLVTGTHTYVIRYRVGGVLLFDQAFDELYWNATGHDWTVPIAATSVTIRTAAPVANDQFACYVGPRGSTTRCDREPAADSSVTRTQWHVDWNEALPAGSGLTVALGFGKGYATEPTWWQRTLDFLKNNPLILLPFAVFGFMFRQWRREGRDPEGRGTIVPEYDVPEGLSPLHIAALLDGRLSGKEIPSAIIDLAVKGYLVIERVTDDGLIFDTTDYHLVETTNRPASGSIERALIDALFAQGVAVAGAASIRKLLATPQAKLLPDFLRRTIETGLPKTETVPETTRRSVRVSELKNKFYTQIPELQKRAVTDLVARRLFAVSPQDVWGKYTLWGIPLCIAVFFLISIFELQGASIVALLISLPIYFVFAYLMPRVTREGAIVKERLLGLKDYLQIAEKRRIEFHNAPEKTPKLFERLLPAALLLGVSDIWAKEFADISMTEPEWYHGGTVSSFSTTSFASDLSGFNASAGQTLASTPSGSGSGGGGFSGGGGGGGGGGSW